MFQEPQHRGSRVFIATEGIEEESASNWLDKPTRVLRSGTLGICFGKSEWGQVLLVKSYLVPRRAMRRCVYDSVQVAGSKK